MTYIPPVNGGRINANITGNTANAGTVISTGTMVLSGGNNITLSQNGNSIQIAGASQSNPSLSLYALGNTTQNSSTLLNASNLSFNALGAVKMGYSNGSIQVSAPAFSAGVSTLGNTLGDTGTVSNQLVLVGDGNITLTQVTDANGAYVAISGSQSVQTQNRFNLTLSGNTAGVMAQVSSGTLTLAGGNNITLSQNGNAVTISGGAGGGGVALYDGANSITSGTASFLDGNGVSFGINGQTITASHDGITSQTNQTINFSAGAGSTLTASGTMDARSFRLNGLGAASVGFSQSSGFVSVPSQSSLYQAGNVSLSTNGGSITISASTQSNQTLGINVAGNTLQTNTGTVDARSMTFRGLGNVSVGYSAGSVQISGSGGGGGVAMQVGANSITNGTASISVAGALGATINAQTLSLSAPGTSSLMAAGAVSISTSSNSITISAPQYGTLSNWEPNMFQHGSISSASGGMGNGTLYFFKLQPQAQISATQLMQLVSMSLSTAALSSHSGAVSVYAGIFTATGSSLSLITDSSGSASYSWSNTSNNSTSVISGVRGLTLPMNINMSPGNYWIGMFSRTSGTSWTGGNLVFTNFSATNFSSFGGNLLQAANATQGIQEGVGYFSSSTTAMPVSAAMSSIVGSNIRSIMMPYLNFKNTVW